MSYLYYLFDLDGTLTDPGEGITNSVIYALKKSGIDPPDRRELYKFIGPPLLESFQKYYGLSQTDALAAVAYYREYFRPKGILENQLYDHIPEVLADLKARGKVLALATSKPEEFAITILKHFDLYRYFDFVGAATMDGSRVQKADIIAYVLERLGVSGKSDVVMIGDRKHDILGAKANGIASAGVLYGYGNYTELHQAGADHIIHNPEELTQVFV